MRKGRILVRALGVEKTIIERVVEGPAGDLVVHVRPARGRTRRCGICQTRCPGYDNGEGRRRWRTLDLGTVRTVLEADAPRVSCPRHGVVVTHVPWARHGAGHTRAFDDQVAWLATQCSKSAVVELMRIAWRTAGAVIARVWADADTRTDRFAGLRRIGIDEISYRKGYKYLTVVVDHDTGRLVWAADGHDGATLGRFFDALGPQRCAQLTHVSADAARWIAKTVTERCPNAIRCADPFHIVAWATEALDAVRRQTWNDARKLLPRRRDERSVGLPRQLKFARWALWKNPDKLTDTQQQTLAWIAKTDPRLHRAYLLKEGLRHVFALGGQAGIDALDTWINWARRCRIPVFIELQRKLTRHRDAINAALTHGLSNARIESTNTRIRLIIRRGFGFHGPEPIIALAMLTLSGLRPTLPGRH